MEEQKRLLILYGSQTGTSKDVGERISMQGRDSKFICTCMPLDEYQIEHLINEELVIFVCSTTGQGEPPENMMKFWRFIMMKRLSSSSLTSLKFGVLGLGDSSYTKFNFIAKKLHRRLISLGGQAMCEVGLADDQHEWGAESVIDSWTTNMWTILSRLYPSSPQFADPLHFTSVRPRFKIEVLEKNRIWKNEVIKSSGGPFNQKNPFRSYLIDNQRVTSEDHFQETRLVKLKIDEDVSLQYQPGDVVMIKPRNLPADVDQFLDVLPFDPDLPINFIPIHDNDPTPEIPSGITLRQLATFYLDFKAVPGRTFFQVFASFSSDENEKEKLEELGSIQGTDDRYDYVNRPRRSIYEVLQDFHKTSACVKLENLLDLIPLMRARAFSVASSPSAHPHQLHILVAVVKYHPFHPHLHPNLHLLSSYKTKLHKRRTGLCSSYLANLCPGDQVEIWLKRGGISFIRDSPNIMVGPGTGIAPFRSACHQFAFEGKRDSLVFFGCRSSSADFYFKDEWKELGVKLFPAFSRDQEDKIYVQHLIKKEGRLLWQLINESNASVFVAGNSKQMPDGVRDAFEQIFQEFGNLSLKEAKEFHLKMQSMKRYQQETWS